MVHREYPKHGNPQKNEITPTFVIANDDCLVNLCKEIKYVKGWDSKKADILDAYCRLLVYQNLSDLCFGTEDVIYWPNSFRRRASVEPALRLVEFINCKLIEIESDQIHVVPKPKQIDTTRVQEALIREGRAEPKSILLVALERRNSLYGLRESIRGKSPHSVDEEFRRFLDRSLEPFFRKDEPCAGETIVKLNLLDCPLIPGTISIQWRDRIPEYLNRFLKFKSARKRCGVAFQENVVTLADRQLDEFNYRRFVSNCGVSS
jgi:hypothetical protein